MNKTELKKLLKGRRSARLVYKTDTKEILGIFHEWRKDNPNEPVRTGSKFGVVEIGHYIVHDYGKEQRQALGLEEVNEWMKNEYNKVEEKRRKIASKKALPILDACERELNNLMKKHGCSLSYCMEGDTHGIYEDYQYIGIEVDGFHFERKI